MNHIKINNPDECYGCRSCENICPRRAIKMRENKEGFIYPYISEEKCINCGLCKKVCPYLNDISRELYYSNPECYAAKTKNNIDIKMSSSGGVFPVLAKAIISKNGIVYGSEMSNKFKVHHISIDDAKGIKKLVGSKYVYSDLGKCFVSIKDLLDKNKLVLFSGVPCQISALLCFLKRDYSNLITVEIICHGTPSQKLFDKYISFLEEKNKAKLKKYSFRDKNTSEWGAYKALAVFQSGVDEKKCAIDSNFDPYYWSFLKGNNFRESCYSCKFAQSKRNADITIGDFWGIEKANLNIDYDNGISAVIINSKKGKQLFESIKDELDFRMIKYELIQSKNEQLKRPTKRPIERTSWYNGFELDNFINNIKIKKSIKSYIKWLIPYRFIFKIKKLLK